MPMYEYHCQDCGTSFNALVKMSDRAQGCPCPNCEGWGDYKISAPCFKEDIMSERWKKNRESHMKKEQKNMKNHGTYD